MEDKRFRKRVISDGSSTLADGPRDLTDAPSIVYLGEFVLEVNNFGIEVKPYYPRGNECLLEES